MPLWAGPERDELPRSWRAGHVWRRFAKPSARWKSGHASRPEQGRAGGEGEARGEDAIQLYRSESRILKGQTALSSLQREVAVEPDFQLIVASCDQEANENDRCSPGRGIQEQSGQKPGEVVSDSGYCSDANLGYLEKKRWQGSWP